MWRLWINLIWIIVLLPVLVACRIDTEFATATALTGDLTPVASEWVHLHTPIPLASEIPTREAATWTPEPISESLLPGFSGFELLNRNPLLDNPRIEQNRRSAFEGYVSQAVPQYYEIYNNPVNADGLTGAEHGAVLMPIIARQQDMVVDIGGHAGEIGYTITVEINGISRANPEPVCLFAQWRITYAIEDDDYSANVYNYAFRAVVTDDRGNEVGLWTQLFPEALSANTAPFWTAWIIKNGTYRVTAFIDIGYALAAPNHIEPDNWVSWVLIRSFAVGIDTEGLHCNDLTPMI